MAKKITFSAPTCLNCQYRLVVGDLASEAIVCTGFKKKNPRKFRRSDPKIRPPKWCPKRLSPTICRIYDFKDSDSEFIERLLRRDLGDVHHPLPSHYKLRMEAPLGMTAKEFFVETQKKDLKNILPPEVQVKTSEIIEIDDGFQPYYFHVDNFASVTPLNFFKIKGSKQD